MDMYHEDVLNGLIENLMSANEQQSRLIEKLWRQLKREREINEELQQNIDLMEERLDLDMRRAEEDYTETETYWDKKTRQEMDEALGDGKERDINYDDM